MYCDKCKKEVDGAFCPDCGADLTGSKTPSGKPKKGKKKGWIIAIIVAIIVIFAVSIMGGNDTDGSGAGPNQEQTNGGTYNEEDGEWIKAGMYKVGSDIPAGEYLVQSTGASCYIQVSSDSSGTLDSIVSNDNVTTHTYITVEDGQYFEVKFGKFMDANKAEAFTPVNGELGEGTYKVGKDIKAGEYKIRSDGSSAYFQVSKDSKNTLNSIVSNDNFTGEKYVTIADGQYITVRSGTIIAE